MANKSSIGFIDTGFQENLKDVVDQTSDIELDSVETIMDGKDDLTGNAQDEESKSTNIFESSNMTSSSMGVDVAAHYKAKTKIFVEPMFHGKKRVAWCLTWASNCGFPAAAAFCRWRGYFYAVDWLLDHNIGKTKLIGEDRVCEDWYCDGFKYIQCQGKP